jgi:hypothetical protein
MCTCSRLLGAPSSEGAAPIDCAVPAWLGYIITDEVLPFITSIVSKLLPGNAMHVGMQHM